MGARAGKESDGRGDLPQVGARFRGFIGEVTDSGGWSTEFGARSCATFRSRRWPTMPPLYDGRHAELGQTRAARRDSREQRTNRRRPLDADGVPDLASGGGSGRSTKHQVRGPTPCSARAAEKPGIVRVHDRRHWRSSTDFAPRAILVPDPFGGGQAGRSPKLTAISQLWAQGPWQITNLPQLRQPQRPEIMAPVVGCVEGMAEACRALDFPV